VKLIVAKQKITSKRVTNCSDCVSKRGVTVKYIVSGWKVFMYNIMFIS